VHGAARWERDSRPVSGVCLPSFFLSLSLSLSLTRGPLPGHATFEVEWARACPHPSRILGPRLPVHRGSLTADRASNQPKGTGERETFSLGPHARLRCAVRARTHPPFPRGFYGNGCFLPTSPSCLPVVGIFPTWLRRFICRIVFSGVLWC